MRTNNSSKRKLLALLLSGMMVSSMSIAFASCNNDSSSSSGNPDDSTTEQTQKDDGLIKNANFEIYNKNSGLNAIGTSVTGWTRKTNSPTSGSALTSKAASGIVDTTNWDTLTTSNFEGEDISKWSEEKAAKNWDNMTVKDKLTYYDAWKTAHEDDDDKSISDLDFYESFNIDLEDLPDCENPRTHDYDPNATETDIKNKNVLMIHNEYYNSTYTDMGTAQKFESNSSVTVKAGTSAEFSVWVKTSDLTSTTSGGASQPAVDKGAYISITNSLGGSSLEPLQIKNIVTEEWTKYTFYLRGSSYSDATFTIVLGLGLGGGTDRSEYVNGYAFFDDITCKTITNEDYVKYTQVKDESTGEMNYTDTTLPVYYDSEVIEKTVNAFDEIPYTQFAIDFDSTATTGKSTALNESWDINPTTEKSSNGTVYTAAANSSVGKTYQGLGLNTSFDTKQVFATKADMQAKAAADVAANADNTYLQTVYNKHFKDSKLITSDMPVLMLLSADGAAYTAKSDAMTFTLKEGQYKAISFLVKTSKLSGFTGANATLLDGDTKIEMASIDTTTVASVDIDDDNKDLYEGWVRCYFFISNETETEKTCSISFGFGPTTVMDTAKSSYYTGFAAFADFQEYTFKDKQAFDLVSSDSYTKIVSLEGKQDTAEGDGGFDTVSTLREDAIETGFAHPSKYKGVYSDSDYIVAHGDGKNVQINQNKNAGLLNKEYADSDEYKAILSKMGGDWNTIIGEDASQPLVIYNEGAQTKSYGYFGDEVTISANSYAAVAVRVKVSNGATAGVYLIDTADESYSSCLTWKGQRVYWYDDDGNVCVKDPSKSKFNPTRDIAFKLQSNGLYKVNPNWEGAVNVVADKYFANLSAYKTDPVTGDKLMGENAVEYDYNDKWQHDGNDGVAFYYKKDVNKYYADSNYTTEVYDLLHVKGLTPRYDTSKQEKQLKQEIVGDSATPVWKTVIFYLHAGSESKTYRLEVWNGTRDGNTETGTGTVNQSGSYVIFDSYSANSTEARFSSLIEFRKETLEEMKVEDKFFEGVYSFYDTDKFLRYDASMDENEVGNSYESYKSSAYKSGIAYLEYVDDENYEIFVDYAHSEQSPSPDAVEDDDDTDKEDTKSEFDAASAWLLAGSIIIAATLLFAVCAVGVRKIFGKRRRVKSNQ